MGRHRLWPGGAPRLLALALVVGGAACGDGTTYRLGGMPPTGDSSGADGNAPGGTGGGSAGAPAAGGVAMGGEAGAPDGGAADGGAADGGAAGAPTPRLTFRDVAPVTEIADGSKDDNPTLTADQTLLCFTSTRAGGTGDVDIWCAARATQNDPFGVPVEMAELNSTGFESSPALSADGTTIWFASDRHTGAALDVFVATRSSVTAPFGAPVPVPALSSPQDDIPRPTALGDTVMPLSSRRSDGVYRIFLAERPTPTDPFAAPTLVTELAFPDATAVDAFLTEDGTSILFTSGSTVGGDPGDLLVARRSSPNADFGEALPVLGVNSAADDRDPWLSPAGQTLFFASNREGDFAIYRATLR